MEFIVCSFVIVLLQQIALASAESCSEGYGLNVDNPGTSCGDIYEKNPSSHGKSGQYLIKTDKLYLAYCDMEDWKGWMKIADLDTNNGGDCPKEWRKMKANDIYVCRSPSDAAGCYSANFSVNGVRYQKIRGLVRGYQKGDTDSFDSRRGVRGIDTTYVDGVSITLGNPRKHVWTYVAGCSDDSKHTTSNCPCALHPGPPPPSFVGDHYYCESGRNVGLAGSIYTSDPLWDGDGCVSASNTCCTNAGLPWFIREFPRTHNEDIEIRICTDEVYENEAVLIDQLKIYIQ